MADHSGAAIAALQAQGAARREPLRFQFITALARRSALQSGAVRQALDRRLAAAVADLQQRLAAAGAPPAMPPAMPPTTLPTTPPTAPPQPGPLATLLRGHAGGTTNPANTAPTELRTLRQFGDTWARLRVDQQLRRAQSRQPENAGPLNSQRLMLQTLQQLRSLSPAYLQRFMAHADALLWLEAAGVPPPPAAPPPGEGGKRRPARRGRA